MTIKIKDIAKEKAVALGINPKAAVFACLGIGKCIQEKMSTLDMYDDIEDYTKDELIKQNLKFNLYKMGCIKVSYPHYKKIRKIFKDVKNRKDNPGV
ncbi:MAG: hypothetical protein IJ180_11340 [Bacteroidales bacterium]|nr:hypothetical protein [Bacteroidales bacterium]MBQ9255350.1 hypothetical protein [Bacteroidales bacterium]